MRRLAPALPIERALPGPGLLAHIAVGKFCDHLPLYRQSEIFARSGLELERGLLAEWMGKLAFLLEPLAAAIALCVRAGAALHADDTHVPRCSSPGEAGPGQGGSESCRATSGPGGATIRQPPSISTLPIGRGEHAERLTAGCQCFLHADV